LTPMLLDGATQMTPMLLWDDSEIFSCFSWRFHDNEAMKKQLRIGIACGGTGGHVFPGLATASVLRKRGHEVTLWLAGRKEEHVALKDWDGPVMTVGARCFSSPLSLRGLLALPLMFPALSGCVKAMRRRRPDVMLAMGSRASVGPALAAKLLGIPLVLHEANVVPGRAIRFLSHWADVVAVGFEETRAALRHKRAVLTGMPLREMVHDENAAESLRRLGTDAFTILVFGGSRGAHSLNMIASAAIAGLRGEGRNVQAIHLAGDLDEAVVRDTYRRGGVPNAVFGFLNAMGPAYRRASFAVCRSGASTCAELSHYRTPALLVPYPLATHQHQLANARALEKTGLADVREEKDLDAEWLTEYLLLLMNDTARLDRMRMAAEKSGSGDAAAALADLVEGVTGKKPSEYRGAEKR
jgi:UDP-N-acetylglucosamine--N-acetylmuramyl-(pentapeptide) pyrophosphoryl-undecaprenol N-acetylglucosamine transferase